MSIEVSILNRITGDRRSARDIRVTLAPSRVRGSILMEVVIALSLFFVAGVFIMDGLNSSIRGVSTIKLEADATDLAVTTYSEVQMGLTPLENAGPVGVAFAGAEGWTYELIVEPAEEMLDMPQLKRLHIVVRNDAKQFTFRTSHLVWDNPVSPLEQQQQLESQLAGEALGSGALSGGNPLTPGAGSSGSGANPLRGGGDVTPQFPSRGGAGSGNTGRGNTPDVTPQFPPRGGNGNQPPRGGNNTGNGNQPPRGGNNAGNNNRPADVTPRFPPRDNSKQTPNATPPIGPRGGNNNGNGRPTPPPAPPADQGENTPQPELDENGNPIPPRNRQGGGQ